MDRQAVAPIYLTLQRYAGWLDRARPSVAVRAGVASLGAAIDKGEETSAPMSEVDASIARLPSTAMRKVLLVTAGQLRHALEAQP